MRGFGKISWAAALVAATLATGHAPCAAQDKVGDNVELVETRTSIPKLKAAAEYKPEGDVIEIELSEYAGYSGLIVANGGLAPNENSLFFKKHGFKVKLTLSEEESWSALNSGGMAASATTVDVLASYGSQFEVVVPALIGFSRGADGVVVRSDIKNINDLRGKVLATAQFTEADFFIRYLARGAGLEVQMLNALTDKPDPAKVNLVFCADGFASGDFFLRDLNSGRGRLGGCVSWAPKTGEVAEKSGDRAYILTTNANLMIVADILVVNKGFAKARPEIVKGLTEGLLEGNGMIRANLDAHLATIGAAFKWDPEETRAQLAKVHLANYPENQAFFKGTIDSAGSFGYIYETAAYVYGKPLIGKVRDASEFLELGHLEVLGASPVFQAQKPSILPIRSRLRGTAERELSFRNVNFRFRPNSAQLDQSIESNKKDIEYLTTYLKVSPGSTLLLRGHADGSGQAEHRIYGGQAAVDELMMTLKQLSQDRCNEIRRILESEYRIDPGRIKVEGVGAAEPTGKGPIADRRVEVKWFTLE